MNIAYIAVTVATASACAYAAFMNFSRQASVRDVADRIGVSQSCMYPFGTLLAAAAVGLLAGIAIPAIGLAASTGLTLYFIVAIAAHIRVHDGFGGAAFFLVMAIASLVLAAVHHDLAVTIGS